MYRTFYAVLVILWILDILDVPCMNFLDTTIPINFLGWLLIWMFIPSLETVNAKKEKKKEKEKEEDKKESKTDDTLSKF